MYQVKIFLFVISVLFSTRLIAEFTIKLLQDNQNVKPAVADGATGTGELRTPAEIQQSTDLAGFEG